MIKHDPKDTSRNHIKEIATVGGGILGLAIGHERSHFHRDFKVSLFEKTLVWANIGRETTVGFCIVDATTSLVL